MTGRIGSGAKYRDQYPELWDEAWLRHRYLTLGMDTTEIAEELGFDVPRHAVKAALERFGIRMRDRSTSSRNAAKKRARDW